MGRDQRNSGGRPKRLVDLEQVIQLRAHGHSWREIAKHLGVGYGTVRRAHQERAKIGPKLPLPVPPAILI